jgi:hypothetical protein
MRPATGFTAPVIAAVAVSVILAACGQMSANPDPVETPTPVASPSADPTPTPKPTPVVTPTPVASPTVAPSPTPVATPAPAPIKIVKHETPMLGRSLADGVNVRERPDLQAPVLRWDNGDGPSTEIRLAEGQVVGVIYGPLYADGESWYLVTSYSSGHNHFGYGWVAGRFLAREAALDDPLMLASIRGVITGLGEGGSLSADVEQNTALGLEFAAAPMPGATSCEIDVDMVGTDGVRVDAASFTASDSIVATVHTWEVANLLVEIDGRVSVQVETDCSFLLALRAYAG